MSNDLQMYHVSFDQAGYMAEVHKYINIAFDKLAMQMQRVLSDVISQCSEAANVMIIEAQKNIKEISRTITNDYAEIEVGIDEGAIGGGEQGYVRVMVTLHGNGEVWARPGGVAWTKHVDSKRKNHVQTEYRLPFFEQSDHSELMVKSFEHDMKQYANEFMDYLIAMLQAIDCEKYLRIG